MPMIFYEMSARKLVYRSMLCAPGAFLIAIGIHGRTVPHNFEFVANDPLTEHRIQAYVPYISTDAAACPGRGDGPDLARNAALKWICGAQRGDLTPLNPVSYDDTSTDGLKSEIFDVQARIASELVQSVAGSLQSHELHNAASDAALVLRLENVLKCSDFASLFRCSTQQRHTLEMLRPYAGIMSESDRRALKDAVSTLVPNSRILERMVTRSQKLFLKWRQRTGCEPLSIEDSRLLSEIPALSEDGNLI